jgi:uncharacterized surface anchored protein
MTRTDVMASSRPHTTRMSSDRPGIFRRLAVVPAVLLVAMALVGPSTASAAEGTSGYSQEPNKPGTSTTPTTPTTTPTTPTTPTTTTPATETSPSKESTTPTATETSPTSGSTTPSPTAKTAKSGTLPFTGFDLRWSLGMGLLLLVAGVSLLTMQRRRGDARR